MSAKIILTMDENFNVESIKLDGAEPTSKGPCTIHGEKSPCREHQTGAKDLRLVKTKTNPQCYWVWDGRTWFYVCL